MLAAGASGGGGGGKGIGFIIAFNFICLIDPKLRNFNSLEVQHNVLL